jgi:SAM-dependent methyltransferase
MHPSSHNKMRSFFRTYVAELERKSRVRILEVGSKSYEDQDSYRSLVDAQKHDYTGLDLEPGLNVDVVPDTPYVWPEISDESFEICISGQTFEHNPFFWVTASEMARVLVPGGYLCIIAPGGGPVHRYPMDCWRFYPDSWSALCALVGLEVVESYWEPDSVAIEVIGGEWRDTMLIARKPLGEEGAEEAATRRAQLISPFQGGFGQFEAIADRRGKCVDDYLASAERNEQRWPLQKLRKKIAQKLYPRTVLPTYQPQ